MTVLAVKTVFFFYSFSVFLMVIGFQLGFMTPRVPLEVLQSCAFYG